MQEDAVNDAREKAKEATIARLMIEQEALQGDTCYHLCNIEVF